jgi:hypothetical protein
MASITHERRVASLIWARGPDLGTTVVFSSVDLTGGVGTYWF